MLNRLALRLSTVRALRDKTLAAGNVFDSEHGAIDEFAREKPRPVIIVYTDDSQYAIQGRDLLATSGSDRVDSGTQKLVIEIAITQRMQVDMDEEGNPVDGVVPCLTDAAMEVNLDLMERQVINALMSKSAWAEMWRSFAVGVEDRATERGLSMRDGVRFAGRQITLGVKLPKDPPVASDISKIGPLWTAFLALADQESELVNVVAALRAILVDELTEYEAVRSAYGLTADEAQALLIEPDSDAVTAPAIAHIETNIEPGGTGYDIPPEDLL